MTPGKVIFILLTSAAVWVSLTALAVVLGNASPFVTNGVIGGAGTLIWLCFYLALDGQ